MSAFGWIKRVLFGAESVAKSGIEKGKASGKEMVDKIQEELSESVSQAKDKFEDLFDRSKETLQSESQKASDELSKMGQNIKEKAHSLKEKGEDWVESSGDKIEAISDKIVEKTDKAWDKISATSESLYDKAKDKIQDTSEKLGDQMEKWMDKAEQLKEDEKRYDEQHPTGIYEGKSHNEKLQDDLLAGTDDFFAKAAAFADGDYDKAAEGKMTILPAESDSPVEDAEDTDTEAPVLPVAGFEDLDGDGDEITDDAIVVSDPEEE